MGKKVLKEELLDNEFRIYVFNKTYKAPIEYNT